MTIESKPLQPDARAEALVGAYERAGYRRIAPPILQPAEPFLDLSGEDIRKRMYLTADADGRELCLRPDLTIPVSATISPRKRLVRPRDFAISARSTAIAGSCRRRSCRPASSRSAGPTRPPPMPKC